MEQGQREQATRRAPSPTHAQFPAAYWTPIAMFQKWLKNPRNNERAVPKVARSIRKYGFVAPVVVWQSQDRLVAGHTRVLALESILAAEAGFIPRDAPGVGLVPVRFHEFTDEAEANAYAIADNKLNEAAERDDDLLAEVMKDLRAADEKLLSEMGFSDAELKALLGDDGMLGAEQTPGLNRQGCRAAGEVAYRRWPAVGDSVAQVTGKAHRILCATRRTRSISTAS